MFQKSISPDSGVLLVEGNESKINASIHMLLMKFDIAAIWINDDFQVVDSVLAKRWKLLYLPKSPARYILELHSTRLGDFRDGDQLRFEDA